MTVSGSGCTLRPMIIRVGLAVVVVLLAAGCGSSSAADNTPAPSPQGAPSSPPTTATTTSAATPTTTPLAAVAGTVPIGTEVKMTVTGYTFRITAIAVNQLITSAEDKAPNGGHFASVDAKFCLDATANGGPTALSWLPWSVTDAASGNYPAAKITFSDFPMPAFPAYNSTRTAVGECARGSIVFPVAAGAMVATVKYSASDGTSTRWAVG